VQSHKNKHLLAKRGFNMLRDDEALGKRFIIYSLISLLDIKSDAYQFVTNHSMLRETASTKAYGGQFLIYESTDGNNIFEIEKEKLIRIITELTTYALFVFDSSRFIKQNKSEEKILEVDCLKEFLLFAIEKLGLDIKNFTPQHVNGATKETACLNLVSFIIGLRITIEVRNANIQLKQVSLESAQEDWETLRRYQSEKTSMQSLNMMNRTGKHAADFFTLPERNKASGVNGKYKSTVVGHSPYDILCGESYHVLASNIRRLVKQQYKDALKSKREDAFLLHTHQLLKHIQIYHQVGQFPPTLVHDIISALKIQFGFSFPTTQNGNPMGAMLDPCAGWGGRIIGALSHPEITTYTGVDPNPSLTNLYPKIGSTYAPHKLVTIFPKKIEDVTKEELQMGMQQEYQLCLTSPPYSVEHYYKGQTFYGDNKNLYQLFDGLVRTANVISWGGFLVINFGIVGPVKKPIKHLPELFFNFLSTHPISAYAQLTIFPFVPLKTSGKGNSIGNNSGKEFLIYARRIANMGPLPAPLPLPSDSSQVRTVEQSNNKKRLLAASQPEESERPAKKQKTALLLFKTASLSEVTKDHLRIQLKM
jgi:hypothetical protein